MEAYRYMNVDDLKNIIDEQENSIKDLEKKIEKTTQTIKYKKEHLERLEKRTEALLEEKKQADHKKNELVREMALISSKDEKELRIQYESDNAAQFVKQTPLDGIKYLIAELESIKTELTPSKLFETVTQAQTQVFSVEFKSETCVIRSSSPNYTFGDLTKDAAVYFSLTAEDCVLKDESNLIWPTNSATINEYNPKENKLILTLKYGRVTKSPAGSQIDLQEFASHSKLESRMQDMGEWVLEKTKSDQKRGFKTKSTLISIFYFSCYVTFLFLLYYVVFLPISLHDAYQLNNSLNNVLISQGFPQDCNYPGGLSTSFLEIFESKQFFCWFSSVLVTELFASPDQVEENGKIFLLRYNQVGGIRFKQYRVKNHSCQALNYTTGLSATTIDCYADYSVAARSEDSYGPYLNSGYNCSGLECQYAQAFQFSNQIPHSYAYTGQISAYDESGFYVDTSSILVNDTLTQTALTDLGTYLQQNSWIDVQTRAVLVTFSFYNINYNYFSGLELLIETSATGYVVPSYKLNTLYLNFYFDSWNQMTDSAYSFFLKVPELYCYVYNILGILVPIIYKLKRRPVEYLKQMWSYIDMILCMLMLGVLIIRIILYYICLAVINSIKEKSFDTSANLSSANFYLSLSWGFESYVVLIASFKVLDYFKIQSMTIIWDTLARGSKSILGFFVVFIVLLCSFTQMANIVYGSQLIDFMNFSRTISSLFLMLLGGLNDYPYMNQVSPYFTPVFFVFYMFLMFFVIMNIFVAILNEAFGVVVEMQIKEHEKEIFGLFVNNLVSEIKLIGSRLKYSCKNCCKKNKVERSVAFKAFNRN